MNQFVRNLVAPIGRRSCLRMLSTSTDQALLVDVKQNVQWIRLNRPKQYNAITIPMYERLIQLLNEAANDPKISMVTFTGTGKYFSSGNDLNNFTSMEGMDYHQTVDYLTEAVRRLVDTFIDFPKPVLGMVNGPAYGIMATTLALFDTVIASDTATFTTPFTALNQSPEGCSSLLFPQILGPSLASEMLLFSRTLSVEDALRTGFVSRVLPQDQLESYVEQLLYEPKKGLAVALYPNAMTSAKSIIRTKTYKQQLHEVNKNECEQLTRMMHSDETRQLLNKFINRKK